MRRLLLPLAAVALAVPGEAGAQRWFAGIGGAVAAVHQRETDVSAVRAGVHLGLGYRVGRGVAVGVEGSAYELGDEEPRVTDLAPGSGIPRRWPEVTGIQVLLAFVQVETAGIYLRPGIGIGRQAFPVYVVGEGGEVVDAYVSHEAGPAAGVAAGYAVPLGGRVSVGFEGVAVLSHGEDSSGARTTFGLRIVPTITL